MRAKVLLFLRFTLAVFAILPLQLTPASGATEKVLHTFIPLRHGSEPSANLTADANGNLYGTTDRGGEYSMGVVFKLTSDEKKGWILTVLYSFKGGLDGAHPYNSGVVIDAAGNLYGTTYDGGNGAGCTYNFGPVSCGTVFKLTPDSHGGWTETVIYNFQGGSDGQNPQAGLIFDASGNLFGTTTLGGTNVQGNGTVFELMPTANGNWTESVLYRFAAGTDGAIPIAALVFDKTGDLYGTTRYGGDHKLGTVFELKPSSQGTWTESVLHSFGAGADGADPEARLIFDSDGHLYSTTNAGGGSKSCSGGCGIVFELKSNDNVSWTEVVLHRFSDTAGDGALSEAGLIFDHAGNLYGVTSSGGNLNSQCPYSQPDYGCGVVFQLTPRSNGQWTETILHTFAGGHDGGTPSYDASLTIDREGNLYGTTGAGGLAGAGTIFKLSRSSGLWKKSETYSFPSSDGNMPTASVVFDKAGNLYGTTSLGGFYQKGSIFKLTRDSSGGWTSRLLYSFQGKSDGGCPVAGLIFDNAGNLYGTTVWGGKSGQGLVFKLTHSTGGRWSENVLYSFSGGADGGSPYAGVIFDKSGNLFGTTYFGGTGGACDGALGGNGCGAVFELTRSASGAWTEKVLYSFTGDSGGEKPSYGSLVFDTSGNLYGTTAYEDQDNVNYGTVFELTPNTDGTWTYTLVHGFGGGNDGQGPNAGLILDRAGNVYGTAYNVFEFIPSGGAWTERVLHNFPGVYGASFAGVVFDASGNIYGSTYVGGTCKAQYYGGCGVIYKLTPGADGEWMFNQLHHFGGRPGDGAVPYDAPVLDAAGNLFGTTSAGGRADSGVVFEVEP